MRKYYESKEYSIEEKYLYLLLIAPGYTNKINEPVRGSTWLQKIMYVLSQRFVGLNYSFEAYDFEVFSPDLQIIQIQNTTSKMIKQENKSSPIYLTEKGLEIAKKLWKDTPYSEREIISETKTFLNDMNLEELIAFSYSTFPETTNSESTLKFVKTRLSSAINLLKREKISLNKASSIAGMSEEEFIQELKKRKISAYSISKADFDKSLKQIENIATTRIFHG